jgi:hypothetical protein
LAKFLRTRLTTFSQAKDAMEAEDWLKVVEKKLVITQFFLPHTSSLEQQ